MLRRIALFVLIASLFVVGTVVAVDRSGVPASDSSDADTVDNYCFTDWAGWCNAPEDPDEQNFRWNLGYWLYQFDAGNVSYAGVPQEFRSSLTPPAQSSGGSSDCSKPPVGTGNYYLADDVIEEFVYTGWIYSNNGSYYADCDIPLGNFYLD